MGQRRYPSKSWAFKSRFSFQFRQQQLYLQYSIQSMLNSLQNGRCSLIFTTFFEHTTCTTKKFLQSIFTFLFHPYLFPKPSLQPAPTLSSYILQQFFTSLLRTRNRSVVGHFSRSELIPPQELTFPWKPVA